MFLLLFTPSARELFEGGGGGGGGGGAAVGGGGIEGLDLLANLDDLYKFGDHCGVQLIHQLHQQILFLLLFLPNGLQ